MNFRNPIFTTGMVLLLTVLSLKTQASEGESYSPQEDFLRGNIAYGNEDYVGAIEAYRAALQKSESAPLHYNLGNALAQTQDWPQAAWHFLKAASLDPALDDARANLLLASTRLQGEPGFPLLAEPANLLPPQAWIWILAIAGWALVLCLFHRQLLPRSLPLARTLALISLLIGLLSGTALYQHHQYQGWGLILTEEEVPLRLAPTSESPSEISLFPGAPVRLIEAGTDFHRVVTTEGAQGFVGIEEVRLLRPL
jgi:tetratricopeptide (TPR) repeat protein